MNIWTTRTVKNCNNLLTLPDSDTDSSSDSECKPNHCSTKNFSHFTEFNSDSMLTANYRNGIGIRVRIGIWICECK